MENEKQETAHEAATEILNQAESKDSGFHYVLCSTHADSNAVMRSMRADDKQLVLMLANIEIDILMKAVTLAVRDIQVPQNDNA